VVGFGEVRRDREPCQCQRLSFQLCSFASRFCCILFRNLFPYVHVSCFLVFTSNAFLQWTRWSMRTGLVRNVWESLGHVQRYKSTCVNQHETTCVKQPFERWCIRNEENENSSPLLRTHRGASFKNSDWAFDVRDWLWSFCTLVAVSTSLPQKGEKEISKGQSTNYFFHRELTAGGSSINSGATHFRK
jgi:hypothetical protein